ncbi:beta-ketoacyl synthase N-terminal-like domain-containing protein [Streptosporangium sp. NPDC049376]|uniref:beta-ketoacyl synthase N-terminal-like domain-containing protein n=1 Tax=Streptosporangium sp. NPDC049376 TaxID=3366192 RepID=UPI00378B7765
MTGEIRNIRGIGDVGDIVVTGVGTVVPERHGPWFDVTTELGPRGYKYLPPASQYLLAAARRAVTGGGGLEHVPAHRRGAAVGTNGALRAYFDDVDRVVTTGHSDDLSPAGAPYFAINVLSGRLASDHQIKAFSLTLTSPRVAGFEAVEIGLRALAAGRADVLIAAAMEHGLPHHAPGLAAEQGAVAMTMEPRALAEERGAPILGSCFARTAFAPPALMTTSAGRRQLAAQIETAVSRLGTGDVVVRPVLDDSAVSRALAGVLAATGLTVRPALTADGGCLAPLLLLARLFGAAERRPSLVITATAEGNFAFGGMRPVHSAQPTGSRQC